MRFEKELRDKSAELKAGLESWATSMGLLDPGQMIIVTIEIRRESRVKIEMKKQRREPRKGKYYRTTERVTQVDWRIMLEHIKVFRGQQRDLLRTLSRSNNSPVPTSHLTSKSMMADMNSHMIKAGLLYRLVTTRYGDRWETAQVKIVRVKLKEKAGT